MYAFVSATRLQLTPELEADLVKAMQDFNKQRLEGIANAAQAAAYKTAANLTANIGS